MAIVAQAAADDVITIAAQKEIPAVAALERVIAGQAVSDVVVEIANISVGAHRPPPGWEIVYKVRRSDVRHTIEVNQDVDFGELPVVICINPDFYSALSGIVLPDHVDKAVADELLRKLHTRDAGAGEVDGIGVERERKPAVQAG